MSLPEDEFQLKLMQLVHSGRGLAKLDQTGKLTYVHQSTDGHWLCLDPNGSFSRTQPKYFEHVTPEGIHPAIIFADGGAPIAVCGDGNSSDHAALIGAQVFQPLR